MMLKPLINELIEMWKGVDVYDSHKQKFILQAAYLWLVHDFMAYGIVVRLSVHGRLTCPICGSDIDGFRLTSAQKIFYFDCHTRWLLSKRMFRMQKNSFGKDIAIRMVPPKYLSRSEIVENLGKLLLNKEGNRY
jgi:hypothetical protein